MSTVRDNENVVRGGSWVSSPRLTVNRQAGTAHSNVGDIGFRPVAEANPNNLRVLRGGFWLHGAEAVRCAYRCKNVVDRHISSMGFRPVAKAKP
jgi:formylglycine-generating enzyme required for sulfatase activity